MNSSHWKKIKEIIEEALDQPAVGRPCFIESACAGNPELLAEVESFLAYEKIDDGFLDKAAVSVEDARIEKLNCLAGRRIGKYKIIREIGAGGMGVVFLAERRGEDFVQKVAVKILRQSFFSDSMRRNFLRERRILASLQDPYIARMLDGGTTEDGTPYLVMEYVEGLPITEYAEEQNLSLREKLRLFLKVCRAVAYAHRHLTVHRDLKPDNILISRDGTPKLLDFGIAKLLSENRIGATQTRHAAFTPEYASPEQIMGEKISTATDVYSLGMILYKLLTGTYPYPVKTENSLEVALSVCRTDPVPPSVAAGGAKKFPVPTSSILKGDLDSIILKALEKNPAARYASVEQLSNDIENYLDGLPIKARRNNRAYRLKKYIGRNRLAAGIALAALMTLVSGSAATFYQARAAKFEREKAERRADNLRKISNALIVEIHDAIKDLPGSLPARKLILTRAVEQLDRLAAETLENPALMVELAQGYRNVGEMFRALGSIGEAEKSHRRAAAIFEKLSRENPSDRSYRKQLAESFGDQGELAYMRGDIAVSAVFFDKSVRLLEKISSASPPNVELQISLWTAYHNQLRAFYLTGNLNEAAEISRRLLEIAEGIARAAGENQETLYRIQISRHAQALISYYLGEHENAIELLRAVVGANEHLIRQHPGDMDLRYGGWAFHKRLGENYLKIGDFENSRKNLTKALVYIENLKNENPRDAGYRRNFSYTLISLADLLLAENKPAQASKILERALGISRELYARDGENGEIIGDLARIYSLSGRTAVDLRNFRRGLEFQEKSIALYERFLEKSPQNAVVETEYIEAAVLTAINYERLRRKSAAEALFAKARQRWGRLAEEKKTLVSGAGVSIKELLASMQNTE